MAVVSYMNTANLPELRFPELDEMNQREMVLRVGSLVEDFEIKIARIISSGTSAIAAARRT